MKPTIRGVKVNPTFYMEVINPKAVPVAYISVTTAIDDQKVEQNTE